MSKTPNYDKKIQEILTATKPGERTCALTGEKWMMTDEEIGWYRKFNVPPSEFSLRTRWTQCVHFTTSQQLWWNKHAETGKPVLSFHHPASGLRVLPDTEWFAHDFSNITQDDRPDVPFFDQLRALQLRVPLIATATVVPPVNSIAVVSFGDQNSYFVLASRSKNSFYATLLMDGENCSDMVTVDQATDCHNVTHSSRLHRCFFVRESYDCIDSAFLFDCRNCEKCFGATNQRNKKYLWFNKQLTKEEWEERRSKVNLGCRSEEQKWFQKFVDLLKTDTVWPQNFNEKAVDCIGEYLTDCTDCRWCYTLHGNSTNNYWTSFGGEASGNAFCMGTFWSEDNYFSMTPSRSSGLKFCWRSISSEDCEYCINCYNCHDCFACVGLQHKSFCIFNKQYTEEDYRKKLDELKCRMLERGEYGRYLPLSMSGTYVGLCGGMIYMLRTREEMVAAGAKEFEQCAEGACGFEEQAGAELKKPEEVPDCIRDVGDEWTGRVVHDPVANRRFTLLKPELDHYRALNIAPPNEHYTRRAVRLFLQMQAATFEDLTCAKCGKGILTTRNGTYPDRKVYCMACYAVYLETRG